MIADYVLDLAEFAICDVEDACKAYRKDPASEFFPKPGQLFKLASVARRDRNAAEKFAETRGRIPEEKDQRPILWWMQSTKCWPRHWRESEVPSGQLIRDEPDAAWRDPERVVF
jgi:hypothetical protein